MQTIMGSFGKINLDEVAQDYPFVRGCLLFAKKHPTVAALYYLWCFENREFKSLARNTCLV